AAASSSSSSSASRSAGDSSCDALGGPALLPVARPHEGGNRRPARAHPQRAAVPRRGQAPPVRGLLARRAPRPAGAGADAQAGGAGEPRVGRALPPSLRGGTAKARALSRLALHLDSGSGMVTVSDFLTPFRSRKEPRA